MRISNTEMKLYYGGQTHSCVSRIWPSIPAGEDPLHPQLFCGQIVPPDEQVEGLLKGGYGIYACVRSDDLKVTCGHAERLYTPSIFSQEVVSIAVAIGVVVAFFAYRKWKVRAGSST